MEKLKDIFDHIYYDRKKIIIVSIIITLIISLFIFYRKEDSKEEVSLIKEENKEIVEPKEEVKEVKIMVDIKGEVNSPGCFEVSDNLRVKDVIELAGGLTKNADTSSINLSAKVHDEMVIVIDKKGEVTNKIESDAKVSTNTSKTSITTTTKPKGKISINKGTLKELTTLTGIGESKAKKIIEYREKNGPFKTLEDIKKVSGIGDAIFAKIKDNITL